MKRELCSRPHVGTYKKSSAGIFDRGSLQQGPRHLEQIVFSCCELETHDLNNLRGLRAKNGPTLPIDQIRRGPTKDVNSVGQPTPPDHRVSQTV